MLASYFTEPSARQREQTHVYSLQAINLLPSDILTHCIPCKYSVAEWLEVICSQKCQKPNIHLFCHLFLCFIFWMIYLYSIYGVWIWTEYLENEFSWIGTKIFCCCWNCLLLIMYSVHNVACTNLWMLSLHNDSICLQMVFIIYFNAPMLLSFCMYMYFDISFSYCLYVFFYGSLKDLIFLCSLLLFYLCCLLDCLLTTGMVCLSFPFRSMMYNLCFTVFGALF